MSNKETLTESMRRYTNIVTEAEQLNENWLAALLRILRGRSTKGNMGKVKGKVSTRIQLSDIDGLAKRFEQSLGENPDKWHLVADIYFNQLKSDEFAKLVTPGTKSIRPEQTMAAFEKTFGNLVDAAARVARDPNDINLEQVSELGLEVISQMRKYETADSRIYLDKLVKKLVAERRDITNVRWAVGVLSSIMAFYVWFFANMDFVFSNSTEAGREEWADRKKSKEILRRDDVPMPNRRPEVD